MAKEKKLKEINKESLSELKNDELVDVALKMFSDLMTSKLEYERLENDAAKDRRIAKQMEGTVKMLHDMVNDLSEMYKGLNDLVKENFSASAVALKSLSIFLNNATKPKEPIRVSNDISGLKPISTPQQNTILGEPRDPMGFDIEAAEAERKRFEAETGGPVGDGVDK